MPTFLTEVVVEKNASGTAFRVSVGGSDVFVVTHDGTITTGTWNATAIALTKVNIAGGTEVGLSGNIAAEDMLPFYSTVASNNRKMSMLTASADLDTTNLLKNVGWRFTQSSVASPSTGVAMTDAGYDLFADWYSLIQGSGARVSQSADSYGGFTAALLANGTTNRFGIAQVVSNVHTRGLAEVGSVVFKIRALLALNAGTGSRDIRVAILAATGGVNDLAGQDVVNDWTSGTYTTGNFFKSSGGGVTYSLVGTSSTSVTHGELTTLATVGVVPATAENLIVMVWHEDVPTHASDVLYLDLPGVYPGTVVRQWVPTEEPWLENAEDHFGGRLVLGWWDHDDQPQWGAYAASTDTTNDTVTFASGTNFYTGLVVVPLATGGGLTGATGYYLRLVTGSEFSFHPTAADALANTAKVNLTASITTWLWTNFGDAGIRLLQAWDGDIPPEYSVSSASATTDLATFSVSVRLLNGTRVRMTSPPTGLSAGTDYYICQTNSTGWSFHTTRADAFTGASKVNITATGTPTVWVNEVTVAKYTDDRVVLWNGSRWVSRRFGKDIVFALDTLTASTLYDVFLYLDTDGQTVLGETVAWAQSTITSAYRAVAIKKQDGRYVKHADKTRLLIGTFYVDGNKRCAVYGGGISDKAQVYIDNLYNQVDKQLYVTESAASWAVAAADGTDQVNDNVEMQFDFVACIDKHIDVNSQARFQAGANLAITYIGVDSIAATAVENGAGALITSNGTINTSTSVNVKGGHHYIAMLEASTGAVTGIGGSIWTTLRGRFKF